MLPALAFGLNTSLVLLDLRIIVRRLEMRESSANVILQDTPRGRTCIHLAALEETSLLRTNLFQQIVGVCERVQAVCAADVLRFDLLQDVRNRRLWMHYILAADDP